jgi:purine-nucleoside phosphorylase
MRSSDTVSKVAATAAWLKARTKQFKPVAAIIAGSGLADSLPELSGRVSIPYSSIPNFPPTTVKGHRGELVFGRLHGKDVVIMRGRFHYHEGHRMNFIAFPVRVLSLLGARTLIVTAAVGSLKLSIRPGDLLILKDHINFMGANPLMGNYDSSFGEMFPDMNVAYDAGLRREALAAARKLKARAVEGVYLAVTGPSYETPAEVRAYRLLGGSVAGMSVVPEVIAARQLGMKVLGVCWISNFTGGLSAKTLEHKDVLKLGEKVSVTMKALLEEVLKSKRIGA